MKSLFIHNFYQQRGGEETTLFNEMDLLKRNGHKVILFSYDNREISSFSLFNKIAVFFGVIFSLSVYRELKKIIEKEKPDIAHIHNIFPLISPSIYFVLKRYGIPVVQTLHNYRLLCTNGLFLRNNGRICELCKKGNFFYAIIYKCYRKSYLYSLPIALSLYIHRKIGTFNYKVDFYLSPSRFLKQKMCEADIPEDKIILKPHFLRLPNLISTEGFDNYSIYMGRLSKEKGLFTLFKAWKNIKEIKLKIIGIGEIQNELQKFILQHRIANIEFLGYIEQEERFEILKKAMFLVFPSECYENMPYTIIESFAYGVPVVASSMGGLRELIEEGVNGFLFEPQNFDDLRQKIIKFINDRELLLKMRYNARKSAEERYSEEIGYRNIINVYQKAITNNEQKH